MSRFGWPLTHVVANYGSLRSTACLGLAFLVLCLLILKLQLAWAKCRLNLTAFRPLSRATLWHILISFYFYLYCYYSYFSDVSGTSLLHTSAAHARETCATWLHFISRLRPTRLFPCVFHHQAFLKKSTRETLSHVIHKAHGRLRRLRLGWAGQLGGHDGVQLYGVGAELE